VDAECGAEPEGLTVGDAGSIVNEGKLFAACFEARRALALGLAGRSRLGGGRGSEEGFFVEVDVFVSGTAEG
jgi:hypothetical protein